MSNRFRVMKFHSLRTKLLLSVCTLVIGSGAIISLLVTHRLGNIWHEATITQGENPPFDLLVASILLNTK